MKVGTVVTDYAYNTLNRLTAIDETDDGVDDITYGYDANGNLTSRTQSSATTTDFTWDPTGLGTVIHVADGTVDDDYLWGLGLIGRIDGAGDETYAHSDGLGSIRSISDSTGVEVGTREYDAFGATRATSGASYAFGFMSGS